MSKRERKAESAAAKKKTNKRFRLIDQRATRNSIRVALSLPLLCPFSVGLVWKQTDYCGFIGLRIRIGSGVGGPSLTVVIAGNFEERERRLAAIDVRQSIHSFAHPR